MESEKRDLDAPPTGLGRIREREIRAIDELDITFGSDGQPCTEAIKHAKKRRKIHMPKPNSDQVMFVIGLILFSAASVAIVSLLTLMGVSSLRHHRSEFGIGLFWAVALAVLGWMSLYFTYGVTRSVRYVLYFIAACIVAGVVISIVL